MLTCVRAEQPSRERTRRKGRLSATLVMPVQPLMMRCSKRVNDSRATACKHNRVKSMRLQGSFSSSYDGCAQLDFSCQKVCHFCLSALKVRAQGKIA